MPARGKRAVCVGINRYKYFPDATLNGCVNDARDMASVFTRHLAFDKRDITLLTDEGATKVAIMSALREAVMGARAGRYGHIAFSMSSHGTQTPDTTGQEPDHLSEAFCPHDLDWLGDATNGHWERAIVDDELRQLFLLLPPDVLLEVYLDTCHSGTGLRPLMAGPAQPRPTRPQRFLPPRGGFEPASRKFPRGLWRLYGRPEKRHHLLWAACAADQVAAEDLFESGFHGAFTWYFTKELRANPTLPRREILARIRADMLAASPPFDQVPQLEVNATGP